MPEFDRTPSAAQSLEFQNESGTPLESGLAKLRRYGGGIALNVHEANAVLQERDALNALYVAVGEALDSERSLGSPVFRATFRSHIAAIEGSR